MLPFCGYHMGDFFRHWITMHSAIKHLPKIFHVNWFRKNSHGQFLWPGFGENMRVLEWMIERCRGRSSAAETVLGWMPRAGDIKLEGMHYTAEQFKAAQAVNLEELKREVLAQQELFISLGGGVPKELIFNRELQIARLCD